MQMNQDDCFDKNSNICFFSVCPFVLIAIYTGVRVSASQEENSLYVLRIATTGEVFFKTNKFVTFHASNICM